MALIQFSEGDKLTALVVDEGWYKTHLTKLDGPKQSNSGTSLNWMGTFQIVEGKYINKEKDGMFNNNVDAASLLGTLDMHPHTDFIQLYAAINKLFKDGKLDLNSVPLNFDTDELLNKPFDSKWIAVASGDGGLCNVVRAYLPAGMGSSQAAQKVPF